MQTKEEHQKTTGAKAAKKMARSLAAALLLLLLIGVAASSAAAQDEPPPPPPVAQQKQEQIETLRVDTELVNLNVSVLSLDRQRPVGELQQKDFQVFENGVPQETAFFASAATPFDLILLLDLSGSTVEKLNLVRKSARRFVEAARPTDRIGVVTFTNQPRIVSPLTLDRTELIERIKKIGKPQGGTNFWDALRFVIEHGFEKDVDGKDAGGQRRKAVVVMTDGVDNALPGVDGDGSTTTFRELLETVSQSDAIVFPIYLDTEADMIKQHRWYDVESTYAIARQQLVQLAAESGGGLPYRARKVEDLNGIYEQVIRDLGTVYSLGYNPTNKERDGSWRAITIQLVNHPELAARTRRGYFAK